MSDETLRNEADTPPSQEFATAIPANSAIPANEQEPVSFEQYKDKAVLPEEEGVIVGELDFDRLASVREKLPALKHRKL